MSVACIMRLKFASAIGLSCDYFSFFSSAASRAA
jgi:hypothetical protein